MYSGTLTPTLRDSDPGLVGLSLTPPPPGGFERSLFRILEPEFEHGGSLLPALLDDATPMGQFRTRLLRSFDRWLGVLPAMSSLTIELPTEISLWVMFEQRSPHLFPMCTAGPACL